MVGERHGVSLSDIHGMHGKRAIDFTIARPRKEDIIRKNQGRASDSRRSLEMTY